MKSRRIQVTRGWVIRAIRRESKLREGAFIDNVHKKRDDCAVCAVGAVMRAALSPRGGNFAINKTAAQNATNTPLHVNGGYYTSTEQIFDAASKSVDEFPWNALSHVFESLNDLHEDGNFYRTDAEMKEFRRLVKEDTIRFVREYFPARVTMEINGFSPAKDPGVKVVR